MIGTLGEIVFVVSADRILTFNGLQRSSSPRFEEHAVIAKKPVLEFVGPGLDTFSFSIRLDVSHGVNPNEETEKIRLSMSVGEALPFVVGGKYYGDWVITSMSETARNIDNRGNILISEIALSLKEARP